MLMSTSNGFHSIGHRNFHWTDIGLVRFRVSQLAILVIAKQIQTAILADQCRMVVATGSAKARTRSSICRSIFGLTQQ